MTAKKIFIICSVREATEGIAQEIQDYVAALELEGHEVHYPPRDTNQLAKGIDICGQNAAGIEWCDEVHVFYNGKSQGIHYDLGVARNLRKPIVVARNEAYGPKKSYPRMIQEWREETILQPLLEIIGELVSDPQAGVRRTESGKFYCRFCSNMDEAVALDPFRITHKDECLLLKSQRLVARKL